MSGADENVRTVFATPASGARPPDPRDEVRSYLAVIEDGQVVGWHALAGTPLSVGRDESRHVVIRDASVSRLHLQVYAVGGTVIAEDLGSSNGTLYEGRPITGPVVLPEGGVLQVGSRLLKHERRSPRDVERAEEQRRDLDKACSYVLALLPAPIVDGPVRTDWCYRPSAQVGGDAFGYGALDEDHLYACLVDVSGHGVGAAMHTVGVLNVLRRCGLPEVDFRDPAAVLNGLNAGFPMDDHGGMFFTLWYGVYSRSTRTLAYASAGHHPAFLREPGGALRPLHTPGPMIGALATARYSAARAAVAPGSALYLFSDGVFEVTTPDGRQCGLADFLPLLEAGPPGPGEAEAVYRAVKARAADGPLADDFTLLVVHFQ